MKLYEIKNTKYETKQVAANDMSEALSKYRAHLEKSFQDGHVRSHVIVSGHGSCSSTSVSEIFSEITSCIYISDYEEPDIIK